MEGKIHFIGRPVVKCVFQMGKARIFKAFRKHYIRLSFLHYFEHHPSSQAEAVLEQQTFCHILKFPHTVSISGEQFFLCIRHGGLELFFVSANQMRSFLVFRTSHKGASMTIPLRMGLYKHRQTRYHLMDMKLIHIHMSKIVYYTAGICAIMHTTDTVI